MFHEVQIINGVLHWRDTPDGEWTAYSVEQLSQMYMDKQNANSVYALRMNRAIAMLMGEAD